MMQCYNDYYHTMMSLYKKYSNWTVVWICYKQDKGDMLHCYFACLTGGL